MLQDFCQNLSVYSVLIPTAIGVIAFRQLDINSRIIICLLLFASLAQLSSVFGKDQIKFACYNAYVLIDSLTWAFIFYRNSRIKVLRRIILCIAFFVSLYSIYNFIYLGIDRRFFNEFVCLNSAVQVLLILLFIYERYISNEVLSLDKEPIFWFSLGLLIYAPCTYFLFAFYGIVHGQSQYQNLWIMHNLINSFMYFIFAYAVYVNVKRSPIKPNVSIRP